MEKTKEQLINDFKKANSGRKQAILKKNGFLTKEEYFASLEKGKKAKKTTKKKELVDYVIAFDSTGSMNAYLADVRNHVEKLIPELFSNDVDLMMRIVVFGDYCDMRLGQFGDAYQESAFTNNQQELIKFVRNARSTSGGDSDEFYELVIKKITEETPWREGSKRSVLFIADCEPHKPGYYYGGKQYHIDWRAEAKQAALKGIAFDTLSIHGETYPWYKELTQITKGVYMPFQSSNKMSEVVTATMYARSGDTTSRAKFKMSFAAASTAGDSELIGTYKSLSTLLDDEK